MALCSRCPFLQDFSLVPTWHLSLCSSELEEMGLWWADCSWELSGQEIIWDCLCSSVLADVLLVHINQYKGLASATSCQLYIHLNSLSSKEMGCHTLLWAHPTPWHNSLQQWRAWFSDSHVPSSILTALYFPAFPLLGQKHFHFSNYPDAAHSLPLKEISFLTHQPSLSCGKPPKPKIASKLHQK